MKDYFLHFEATILSYFLLWRLQRFWCSCGMTLVEWNQIINECMLLILSTSAYVTRFPDWQIQIFRIIFCAGAVIPLPSESPRQLRH